MATQQVKDRNSQKRDVNIFLIMSQQTAEPELFLKSASIIRWDIVSQKSTVLQVPQAQIGVLTGPY